MNPRHSRRLMFGLLLVLLVVVVINSLVKQADGAPATRKVATLSDPRITESSGLALSRSHPDVAYTVNDSGHAPIVFAVSLSTGRTVGTATLAASLVDVEAIAVDPDGRIWVADIGDNRGTRDSVGLYVIDEFARGDVQVTPKRYDVAYPDGPTDAEALAIHPVTGQGLIVAKSVGGAVYEVPAQLRERGVNRLKARNAAAGPMVTDAAYAADGRHVVVRDYLAAHVFDARDFTRVETVPLPLVKQGESLAVGRDGASVLVGSEGASSPLYRAAFSTHADVGQRWRWAGPQVATVLRWAHLTANLG
jgi:sugar lactone lactonase YvrE